MINQAIHVITVVWILRSGFLIVFSLLESRRSGGNKKELKCLLKKGWPSVSVVIAAFNEEKTIGRALDSILASHYPSFEVLVVNDGSTDTTNKVVREYQATSANVKLIDNLHNLGKANSLNIGIAQSNFDIIVTLDADTVLSSSKSIKKIVLPLIYHEVSAVACNVKISNKQHLITKFQSLEYIQAIHTVKRARSFWNCILILPGAASAYKKEALISVDGFSSLTLTEDADLTLCLLKKGCKIIFQDDAVALTEAPFTLRDLFKQRIRWQVGNIQCVLKHIDWISNPKISFFPRLLFLDYCVTSLVYFIFIPLFLVVVFGLNGLHAETLFGSLLPLFFMEFMLTIFAYSIANENKYELLYFIPQKIFFLFFNTYLTVCILIKFLAGKSVSWHPIQRAG
jgi:cellulose synthase/poly-beta-1,6-N-acetylglucosamine synthase-like glycosyltransferase